MTLLTDMEYYLGTQGLGAGLFAGNLPDNPTDTVAMFQYAGRAPEYVMSVTDEGTPIAITRERPGLQLQSRAQYDADAEENIYRYKAALEFIVNQTINGTYYVRISCISAPYHLRKDEQNRAVWACNFATEKEM